MTLENSMETLDIGFHGEIRQQHRFQWMTLENSVETLKNNIDFHGENKQEHRFPWRNWTTT